MRETTCSPEFQAAPPAGLSVFRRRGRLQIDWYHRDWRMVAWAGGTAAVLALLGSWWAVRLMPVETTVCLLGGLGCIGLLLRPGCGHGWHTLEIDRHELRLIARFPLTHARPLSRAGLHSVRVIGGEAPGIEVAGAEDAVRCFMRPDQAEWVRGQIERCLAESSGRADGPQRISAWGPMTALAGS
ncbi:MAG: hypothetical protein ACREJB_04975 [Planctomycetaceae bacterium]